MKKFSFFATSLFVATLFFSCNAQDVIIPASELPAQAQSFVKQHFPEQQIEQAEKDKSAFSVSYEVILDNMIELDFDKDGKVTSIDGNTKLPSSVIPAKIADYVSKNYASNYIVSWNLDDNRQEIELDNGLDLEFSKEGDFKRIDK